MRIVVLTTCTGSKALESSQPLTWADFEQGKDYVKERMQTLPTTSAESLYTGQQHLRLMRGIQRWRKHAPNTLDLYILSAGYGLVPGHRHLAPYDCSFVGLTGKEIQQRAKVLAIPRKAQALLESPYDLALLLLSTPYLTACGLKDSLQPGGPVLAFCGEGSKRLLPENKLIRPITLTTRDAKRFHCGQIALKGEVAARLLDALREDRTLWTLILQPGYDLLGNLTPKNAPTPRGFQLPDRR